MPHDLMTVRACRAPAIDGHESATLPFCACSSASLLLPRCRAAPGLVPAVLVPGLAHQSLRRGKDDGQRAQEDNDGLGGAAEQGNRGEP